MGKSLSLEQQQVWVEKIRSQKTSGLSINRWCKNAQIAPHVFYYWKRRLLPDSINRSSFAELTSQKRCTIEIKCEDVCIHIEAPNRSKAFQALRELRC
jgi:hypothetical protein